MKTNVKYQILQMKQSEAYHGYRFEGTNSPFCLAKKIGNLLVVPCTAYRTVFTAERYMDITDLRVELEKLFVDCQCHYAPAVDGKPYRAASLSVSDIVSLTLWENVTIHFFVDSFGFMEVRFVPQDFLDSLEGGVPSDEAARVS